MKLKIFLFTFFLTNAYAYGIISVKFDLFPYANLRGLYHSENLSYLNNWRYMDQLKFYENFIPRDTDVVMLGDSLVHGANWNSLLPVSVVNQGIQGDITEGAINRLDLVFKFKPKKVFIMLGVNDINLGMPVEKIFENYKTIINSTLERKITVIIQSTLLTSNNKWNKNIEDLNLKLAAYCKEVGVAFIDLNAVLALSGLSFSELHYDDVHLRSIGYILWRNEILKHI